jgi:hypothetical protein
MFTFLGFCWTKLRSAVLCKFGTIRAIVREEALLSGMALKASLLVLVCRQIGGLPCQKDL